VLEVRRVLRGIWKVKFFNLIIRITHRQNDPNFKTKKENPIFEIMRILKERHKRTVERKLENGDDLIMDEKLGIINSETNEVVLDIKYIYGDIKDDEEDTKDLKEEEKENNEDDDLSDEEYEDDEDISKS
jgi:hypothetical protein